MYTVQGRAALLYSMLEKATSTCLCCLCVWSARARLLSPLALRVYHWKPGFPMKLQVCSKYGILSFLLTPFFCNLYFYSEKLFYLTTGCVLWLSRLKLSSHICKNYLRPLLLYALLFSLSPRRYLSSPPSSSIKTTFPCLYNCSVCCILQYLSVCITVKNPQYS